MRVCLFGCGGFIGSHLVEWLLENSSVEVVGTDITHEKVSHLLNETRFTYYDSDIAYDRELTRRLIATSDVVIDLVAIASPAMYTRDPAHVFELDFLENLRVARECAAQDKRLIQFSTCEVYGPTWLSLVPDGMLDPSARSAADIMMREDETPLIAGPVHKTRWIYAASKHLLERAIHAYGLSQGLDYTIIRPFNFIGSRFDFLPSEAGDDSPRMFAQFMAGLLYGTKLSLVDGGKALRTYIYIDDAVECIGRVILDRSGATSRQIINVGNPDNEVSVEDFARMMLDTYVNRHWDGVAPLPQIVSVQSEDFFGEGYEDCDRRIPDINKARVMLGWEPTWSLDELIAATMDAFVADFQKRELRESARAART